MSTSTSCQSIVTGNYFDKYNSPSRIHRRLVTKFVSDARELLALANPRSLLEVGCASGDLAARLLEIDTNGGKAPAVQYAGLDISGDQIALAKNKYPALSFQVASAYEVPFENASFDLVVLCEVLEHLETPEIALLEAARVSRGYLLASVPWEPVWRLLNVVRGKYWRSLGNTPGHVQHFSRHSIRNLIQTNFEIVAERRPFPWSMFLAKRKNID